MAKNWTLVCKDSKVFSLFSANSTHLLWLVFKLQHKPHVFLALQGYCCLQSCAPALAESLTWTSGDSRNSGSAGISLCVLFVLVPSCPQVLSPPTTWYFVIHTLNLSLSATCPGHFLLSLSAWTDPEWQQFSDAIVTLSACRTDSCSCSSTQFLVCSFLTKELLSC